MFFKPHPSDLMRREYDEARRELLVAQSGLEYAQAMVKYHSDRIARLGAEIEKLPVPGTPPAAPTRPPKAL